MNVTENIEYAKLAQALLSQMSGNGRPNGWTGKAVSSTPTAIYPHGPGGLFSYPGLSQPLFSAMLLPAAGVQSRLPVIGTNETNPLFGIMTGVTASSGSEADGPCDDPPTAGNAKLCTTSYVFGRFSRMTPVIDIDKAGRVVNRGEFTDLTLMNSPFDNADRYNIPSPIGNSTNQLVNSVVGKALFELGAAWSRDFAQLFYTGNPTNNTANGGYQEFRGLDSLINTGYQDAITGQACPAADSLVVSFGNQNVASSATTLFNTITYIYRNLKYIASRTGLTPVKWVIAMPWALFYEVANIWACAYMSTRCGNGLASGSTQFVDARETVQFRDDMLGDMYTQTGMYLPIDGERVEVIADDAITETDNGGGTFTSQIYFIPMTVQGRTPVTYMEYFDYTTKNGAIDTARVLFPAFGANPATYQATDNGRFLWHFKPPTNFCVQMLAKTEPRVVLRTPFLAARVTNVRYTPYLHNRSWDPDAGPSLYANGGRTNYNGYPPASPSFYPPTS